MISLRPGIGAFADLVFEVSTYKVLTYDDYKRESKARYARHELINQTTALEYLGRDLEEISFKMTFTRTLGVDPEAETEKARQLCLDGVADYLILGNEVPFKLFLNFRNNLLLLENNLPSTLHSRRKARLRIWVRMCLDGLSALVYLCKGQGAFFMAVVRAHRDYRKLRRPGELLPHASRPEGLYAGWIVPVGLFGKK